MPDRKTNSSVKSAIVTEESNDVEKSASSCLESDEDGEVILEFEDNDSENPLNWPYWRKVSIQLLCASMYMVGNFGTVTIVPAVPKLLSEFHASGNLYSTILVSIWEFGEVFGPFIAGPLSERYGRLPVFHIGNILFVIISVVSALSTNIPMLVILRFLNGLTTTSMTLGPSIVGDCFLPEDRGKSMAIAIAIPLIGPFAGPVIGGYLGEKHGWRWCIWFVTILAAFLTLLSAVTFKETYKPIILERKARRIGANSNKNVSNSRPRSRNDHKSFLQSISRPLKLLTNLPIAFIIPLYSALSYGLSYVILTTLAPVMQSTYRFSETQTGATFIARGLGNLLAMFFYNLTSDRYFQAMKRKRQSHKNEPEDRLPHLLFGAVFAPVGVLLYGWGADFHLSWAVPVLGTLVVGFSMTTAMLASQNYLVDIFDLYSASAIAVANALTALSGTLFPLCGPPLFEWLGLGWGNTSLAVFFALWWPVLFVVFRCGKGVRERRDEGAGNVEPAVV